MLSDTTTPSTARPSIEKDSEKAMGRRASVDVPTEFNEKGPAPESSTTTEEEGGLAAWSTVVAAYVSTSFAVA